MDFKADIDGHGISLRCTPGGYADAAVVNDLAGLEIEITGTVVIHERDDGRPNVLSLAMTPDRLRDIALIAAQRSGMPLFTEREWHMIADGLKVAISDESLECDPADLIDIAERIRGAYTT